MQGYIEWIWNRTCDLEILLSIRKYTSLKVFFLCRGLPLKPPVNLLNVSVTGESLLEDLMVLGCLAEESLEDY